MAAIDITLTPDQLYALGSQVAPLGTLSPLRPKTEEQQELAGSRIVSPTLVNQEGKIHTNIKPVFNILANPSAYVYLVYIGRSYSIESTYYYPQMTDSSEYVSMIQEDGNLKLSLPGNKEQVIEALRQFIGETLFRRLDYEYSLSLNDAWVLFATIDASRRQMLETHLDYRIPTSIQISKDQIYRAIQTESDSMQWLSPYYAHCLSLAKISKSDVDIGINNLANQGIVDLKSNAVIPSDTVGTIANEYLITDGHLRLRASLLAGGQPQFTDFRAVQGRSGAILLWSYDDQSVDLLSLSPAECLLAISGQIENPALHLEGDQPLDGKRTESPPPPEMI